MDLRDFLDIAYAYSINAPESRNIIRTGMLGFMFEFTKDVPDEEMTHEQFVEKATSKSMLDELDAFRNQLG